MEKTFNNDDFVKNFRMGKQTFNFLCQELQPYLHRQDTNMRKAISVRRRVEVAIWRLATNADYRTITHLFGVSSAIVCHAVDEFCTVVSDIMLPRFVKMPKGQDLVKNVLTFKDKWGYPQCVGAIDKSHIPIKASVQFHADYYNSTL